MPFAFRPGGPYCSCKARYRRVHAKLLFVSPPYKRLVAAGGRGPHKLSEDRMDGIDEWLQRLSWLALIALPILLCAGGYAALLRLRLFEQHVEDALEGTRTSRLLEILQLVGQPGIREARATVLIDVPEPEQRGEKWWEENSSLHRAAEQVCLSYDHIGGLINFDTSKRAGEFFLETWGEDIIRVHDILKRYLEFRRKSATGAYQEFSWLAQEAELIHRNAPPVEPEHPVRTIIRHLKN